MRCSAFFLFLLVMACLALPAVAQGPVTWTWAQQTGGILGDGSSRVTAASAGAIYQTGTFRSTITCGTTTMTNSGSQDMYLVKYDSQGNVLWARQASSQGMMYTGSAAIGLDITADAAGNVYVTGSFTGRVTFGSTVLTSPSSTLNTFIVKYNAQGTPLWARMAGGMGPSRTEPQALALDATGNLVVAGSFRGNTSFGGATLTSQGEADIFLAKLDASTGATQWSQSAGGQQYDDVADIAIGPGNTINVTGAFSSTAAFGSVTVLSYGGIDGFLAQYTAQGTVQWVQGFGGPGDDSSNKIVVTPTNQLYSVGYFAGTASIGSLTLTSRGNADAYLLKADNQGTVLWARQMGGVEADGAYDLELGPTGAVYVLGNFRSAAEVGTQTLNSAGGTDIFVARYDPLGQFAWATRVGGVGNDYGTGLAITSSGTLYLGGIFLGTIQLGALSLTSRGLEDAFLCQFNDNIPTAVRVNAASEQFVLYPNPVTGPTLTLNVPGPFQEPVTIDLLDSTGKQVKHLHLENVSRSIVIDPHDLVAGHYLLRFVTSTTSLTRPFSIN